MCVPVFQPLSNFRCFVIELENYQTCHYLGGNMFVKLLEYTLGESIVRIPIKIFYLESLLNSMNEHLL